MVKTNHRAYERPEAELFDFILESSFLILSANGGEKPVDDAEDGDTEGWGWN